MKIVYLLKNPGISSRTPAGWQHAVMAAQNEGTYTDEDLEKVVDADFLVVGLEPVNTALLGRTQRLKLIQRLGVGYNNIDLEAAAQYGVPVCNMPDFNAATVAEHTLMLILALYRRIVDSTFLMKAGKWSPATVVGKGIFDLQGKTVGILGIGAIGRAVARRARPFDVALLYHDKERLPKQVEEDLGISFVPIENLLSHSDILTLHLPLTSETYHLIGKNELQKMKRTAVVINTARGAIIDEHALAKALETGTIGGAGLDVFSDEPLSPQHPLRRCPNILLTPHTAGQTREAMDRMTAMMLKNIQRVVEGQKPHYQVNAALLHKCC